MASERRSRNILWWIFLLFRGAIFVLLLYGIDRTPLAGHRVVAYFHLGTVSAWFTALAVMIILWWTADMVLNVLLLAIVGAVMLLDTIKAKTA